MATACVRTSVYGPVQLAPRYEALFQVSDCLRALEDLRELFRTLPRQLRPVVDFDYMSIFLDREFPVGARWHVLDEEDQSTLTVAQDTPPDVACAAYGQSSISSLS